MLAVLAVVLDQAAIGSIGAHLAEVYRGYGAAGAGAESWVVSYLVAVGVLGAAGWLWVIRGAARRRRWAAPVATALSALGWAFALVGPTVSEYGVPLVPTWLGLLGLLPCAVGVAAVVSLRRGGRGSPTGVRWWEARRDRARRASAITSSSAPSR